MADNTTQTGSAVIAADEATTLNGAASSGVLVQRVKVTFGDDGTARDVSANYPLPIDNPDLVVASSLSALGSVVVPTAGGNGVVGIQVSGTFVATLAFEATTDGTNWFAVNGVASVIGTQVSTTTAPGQWRVNSGGYQQVRVRATAYTSGTIPITMVATSASTMTTLAEPLPVGVNQIGTVGEMRASTLAVTATAALSTAATVTLPAAGAGLFHYVTSVQITAYSAAARTGSATPWVVTTTNLPGSPAWTFSTAGAIGATDTQTLTPTTPMKASAANTATTVAGPAATSVIWRITVTYFVAA